MKVTVLGGGGFIGSAIIDRLLGEGHSIRVFERPRIDPYRPFTDSEQVEWINGDLMSVHDIREAVRGVDAVMHLVSTTLPKSSNDDPIYDVQSNLIASLQLLQVMVEEQVRRVVFISSGGTVYGQPQYLPIDERHPTEPMVSYGITKLAIEKFMVMFQHLHGLKPVILRVTNPYGERQRVETAQGAVGVFLDRIIRGQPIEIWGDGSVSRDYIHVSDVAQAFARALTYEGSQVVFNVSTGKGTPLTELLQIIGEVTGLPVNAQFKPARPFDVPVSVLDNTLAQAQLGWKPVVSLSDGIARTAQWMRSRSS
ncbi:MAG: NAD-dependent epimerase/dehydratase family protein [Burkholderiales bacterium]|jgi:UDP-glucose 4-epimerase|nr:NAD-dependent epimerase/dehydratase family protein [Burkholderiales bacterium]